MEHRFNPEAPGRSTEIKTTTEQLPAEVETIPKVVTHAEMRLDCARHWDQFGKPAPEVERE